MTEPELTEIERRVIDGWCEGLTNEEISEVMRDVSRHTIKAVGRRVILKLRATCPRHATAIWTKLCAEVRPV